jgi:hypothetical protein
LKTSLRNRKADYAQAAAELKMALTQLVERRTKAHIGLIDVGRVPEEAVKYVFDWLIQTNRWQDLSHVSAMIEAFVVAGQRLRAEENALALESFEEPEYIGSSGSDYVIRIASEPELQERLLRLHAHLTDAAERPDAPIEIDIVPANRSLGVAKLSVENDEAHFVFQLPGFVEIIVRPYKNEWIWRGDGAFSDVIFAIKNFLDGSGVSV